MMKAMGNQLSTILWHHVTMMETTQLSVLYTSQYLLGEALWLSS